MPLKNLFTNQREGVYEMINEAMHFAISAHQKQTRKGTGIPYVFHPMEVGYILAQATEDEEVICAGILHDTLEDAKVSSEAIKEIFSERVAKLVAAQSENKALSWKERKQHTLDYFKAECKSEEEALICCADKLSNIRSIQRDLRGEQDKLWNRFREGREMQKWYYEGLIKSLERLSGYDMYQEFKSCVEEVFFSE
jgi:GTP diphosphokinase / guanosine-3',5'-bis(diphosphate) 3'-diphosphatase